MDDDFEKWMREFGRKTTNQHTSYVLDHYNKFKTKMIEQARASCLNECAGCHEKKFATIPFCQRCIIKKEASIRASAFQEGIDAVEKELRYGREAFWNSDYSQDNEKYSVSDIKKALAAARNAARKVKVSPRLKAAALDGEKHGKV